MSIFILFCITGFFIAVLALSQSIVSKKYQLRHDPRIDRIVMALPGVNCTACGYRRCSLFARAVVEGKVPVDGCMPGGARCAHEIGDIMGITVAELFERMAVVHCKGGHGQVKVVAHYDGLADCYGATLVGSAGRACNDGCLGLGSCVRACPFGALSITANGVALVDQEKCNGCGLCVKHCPRAIISLIPRVHKIFLACSNHDWGSGVLDDCSVGCTACTLCVLATPSGAIVITNNLPVLDYQSRETFVPAASKCPQKCFVDLVKARPRANIDTKCDGCAVCLQVCPIAGAIEGTKGMRHRVVKELCIGCGICLEHCHAHAISLWGGLGYKSTTMPSKRYQR